MKKLIAAIALSAATTAGAMCPYDTNCLNNPYGAGSPFKPDGLMNPFSEYGSQFSNKSWTNPYATDAPKIYDQNGNYQGRLSTNRFEADSISNPTGVYGSPFRPGGINNQFSSGTYYIVPQ